MNARLRTASDYMVSFLIAFARGHILTQLQTSKLAISRLVEFIALEYPSIPVFAMHPGSVATDLSMSNITDAKVEYFDDTPQLGAGTALQLTSGRFDWLSGR